jgi:hypothetical protein
MGFLSGWTYRKPVTLSRASGAVTAYQMKLLVGESSGSSGAAVHCEGHGKVDFSDLRFTTSDGTTLLDYWIESVSGTTPNQTAVVWIEFNSIGTGPTSFFLYYGNADAAAASSGGDTFPFFDDFSGDLGKWTGATANYRVNAGHLERKSYDTPIPKTLRSPASFNPNGYALRWRTKENATADGTGPIGFYFSDTRFGMVALNVFNGTGDRAWDWAIVADGAHWGTNGGDGALSAGVYYIIDLLKPTTTSYRALLNGSALGDVAAANQDADHCVGISAYDNSADYRYFTDWILVRKFNPTEPAWGAWGSEETEASSSGVIPPAMHSYRLRRAS